MSDFRSGGVNDPRNRGIGLGEHLRVPLHGQHRSSRKFDDLDHTVVGMSASHETATQVVEHLVMQTVHGKVGTEHRTGGGTSDGHDPMEASGSIVVKSGMTDSVTKTDVLHQCAPQGHVQQLGTSTDTQDRHILLKRRSQQGKFPRVTIRFDFSELRRGGRPVDGRIDVGTASEHQCIESGNHVADIGISSQPDRQCSCRGERR